MDEAIRILHVDDDPGFLELTTEFLRRENERFEVITAERAADGLDRLRDEPIDCVVSDYEMPGMDGQAFLEAVREEYPELPFVLYTGKGSEEVASDAISAGVTDYLQKGGGPDQYAVLANRIENAVAQHRSTNQLELFRTLVDRSTDGIFVIDPETGRYLDANESACRRRGYTREELLDLSVPDVVPERPDLESWHDIVGTLREEGELTVTGRHQRKDGSTFPVEANLTHVELDREYVLAVCRDLTERRERERELREKSNILDQLFEQVPTHLYVKDREGRHLRVSDHLDGVEPEALVGKTDREVYPEALSGETGADDRRVIETGEPILNKEERSAHDDAWNLTSKVPWYGEDGEVKGLIGVTRRITKRKEYEQELRRRNEQLEELVGIISHDLQSPMGVLEGSLELAEETGDPEQFERCRRTVDRMGRLVDDLLTLARQGETIDEAGAVELARVAEDAWRTVDTGDATLVVDADGVLCADEGRLAQLLSNLLGNAVDHGGETVTVGDLADGFYVADDGPGIPPDERERVFDSGYSTADDGVGLGLRIVEWIADAHGWEVSVTGGGDGGARFEITGVAFA